jgi:hypothetical protein
MDRTIKMGYTSQDLINIYKHTGSGYFFSPDTMRFFKSRVTGLFKRLDDKTALFVTTEKGPMPDSPRRATVRLARIIDSVREDGDLVSKVEIDTMHNFNQLTMYKARKLLVKTSKEEALAFMRGQS